MKKILAILFVAALLFTQLPDNKMEAAITEPVFSYSAETPQRSSLVSDDAPSEVFEMRAAWLASVKNYQMPANLNEIDFMIWSQMVCEKVRELNMNTIAFQVKPTADALYKSDLAPWSRYITGTQGQDPGYDPLQIMIESAHREGLELHAWINPYRVSMPGETLKELSGDNIAAKNPTWAFLYGGQYFLNPGIPEVRSYLVESMKELAANYDIDAIHMDDYFYPYPKKGEVIPDSELYKKYGASFSNINDWRRKNINSLVSEINAGIKQVKPNLPFGISPFGVWRNIDMDNTGSNTKASITNYDSIFADTRQWMREGSIDYIVPQIYWTRGYSIADYSILAKWWSDELRTYSQKHPINMYVGLASYKAGDTKDARWKNADEISAQISEGNTYDNISGFMHYSYNEVVNNVNNHMSIVKNNNYKTLALTPAYPWLGSLIPEAPQSVNAVKSDDFIKVEILNNQISDNVRKYLVYRFNSNTVLENISFDNNNIVGVIYKSEQSIFIDKTAIDGQSYFYAVKSVSNTGIVNENAAISNIIK